MNPSQLDIAFRLQRQPALVAELESAFGSTEVAMLWLFASSPACPRSPAQLLADGNADAVRGALARTLHGFVG